MSIPNQPFTPYSHFFKSNNPNTSNKPPIPEPKQPVPNHDSFQKSFDEQTDNIRKKYQEALKAPELSKAMLQPLVGNSENTVKKAKADAIQIMESDGEKILILTALAFSELGTLPPHLAIKFTKHSYGQDPKPSDDQKELFKKLLESNPLEPKEIEALRPYFEKFMRDEEKEHKDQLSKFSNNKGPYEFEGHNLKRLEVDDMPKSERWPNNTQVYSVTNQNNTALFGNNVPHLVERMKKTDSLSEAAIDMTQTGGYVDNNPWSRRSVVPVTPLLSTNVTPEAAIWKKNDPTVKRRIMVMAEDQFPDEIQEKFAKDDRELFQKSIQEQYGTKEVPVEFVMLKGKTKQELKEAFDKLSREATSETEFGFRFFAHGVTEELNIQKHPEKFSPKMQKKAKERESLQGAHEGILRFSNGESLFEEEVKQWMKPFSKAKGVFLMVESCFSGAWIAKQDGNIDPNNTRLKLPSESLTFMA